MQANRKLRAPRGGRVSARRTPGGAAPRWPRASVGLQFACQRISASSWWETYHAFTFRRCMHARLIHRFKELMDESSNISKSGLREALNTASSANLISMDQHGEIGSILNFSKYRGYRYSGTFLVQCTYSCCISTCTVVNFPCESQKSIWSNDLPLPF